MNQGGLWQLWAILTQRVPSSVWHAVISFAQTKPFTEAYNYISPTATPQSIVILEEPSKLHAACSKLHPALDRKRDADPQCPVRRRSRRVQLQESDTEDHCPFTYTYRQPFTHTAQPNAYVRCTCTPLYMIGPQPARQALGARRRQQVRGSADHPAVCAPFRRTVNVSGAQAATHPPTRRARP